MTLSIELIRIVSIAGIVIVGISIFAGSTLAQEPETLASEATANVAAEPEPSPTPLPQLAKPRENGKDPVGNTDDKSDEAAADDNSGTSASNGWYTPPTPAERRKRYLNSVIGPVALIRYSTVAGVLTARNAPREWGGQWEGFGRRFASNLGESAINNTVKFGLDAVLEVDSRFYLSRDRRPVARARNAVFSSVTARNREGKRVFGTPKIAGHLLSNVISATAWYPDRYGYKHGLKGAAISFAVDAGVNLFREFFWKK